MDFLNVRKVVCSFPENLNSRGGSDTLFILIIMSISMPLNEPVHLIFNNVVGATSKASDQPAHTRSLIRAFASSLSIL